MPIATATDANYAEDREHTCVNLVYAAYVLEKWPIKVNYPVS
jgi:hypothetical protein